MCCVRRAFVFTILRYLRFYSLSIVSIVSVVEILSLIMFDTHIDQAKHSIVTCFIVRVTLDGRPQVAMRD